MIQFVFSLLLSLSLSLSLSYYLVYDLSRFLYIEPRLLVHDIELVFKVYQTDRHTLSLYLTQDTQTTTPKLEALFTYMDEILKKGFIQPSKLPTRAPFYS